MAFGFTRLWGADGNSVDGVEEEEGSTLLQHKAFFHYVVTKLNTVLTAITAA